MAKRTATEWDGLRSIASRSYVCGYCGNTVAPEQGYFGIEFGAGNKFVYICPWCRHPTHFDRSEQTPGVRYGNAVGSLPPDISKLYDEARDCMAVSAYTAAVLLCRKLLMNVAVAKRAKEGRAFIDYVSHLDSSGYVPPDGRGWVDHIRKKGNEANHEIALMSREDAEDLVTFLEMLLKFMFEFPSKIPQPGPVEEPGEAAADGLEIDSGLSNTSSPSARPASGTGSRAFSPLPRAPEPGGGGGSCGLLVRQRYDSNPYWRFSLGLGELGRQSPMGSASRLQATRNGLPHEGCRALDPQLTG